LRKNIARTPFKRANLLFLTPRSRIPMKIDYQELLHPRVSPGSASGRPTPSRIRSGLRTASGKPGGRAAGACFDTSTIKTPPAVKNGISCPTFSKKPANRRQIRRADGG
jgi:hypothetical protein